MSLQDIESLALTDPCPDCYGAHDPDDESPECQTCKGYGEMRERRAKDPVCPHCGQWQVIGVSSPEGGYRCLACD
ncbi:MAG: hypothetical protein KC492_45330, partial [Myxococcales bacterium]|nr:hypothetical protein [Myxococcales bacterium]